MNNIENNTKEELGLGYLINSFKKYWLIYVGCLVLALLIAFVKNNTKLPVYESMAKILINEGNNSVARQTSQFLSNMDMFSGGKTLENEIQLLGSAPLIEESLKNLDLSISYYKKSSVKISELYKSSPFLVSINIEHPQLIDYIIQITILDSETYRLKIKGKDIELFSLQTNSTINRIPKIKTDIICKFGDNVTHEYFDFKLLLNKNSNDEFLDAGKYFFVINKPKTILRSFQNRLVIEPNDAQSSVANLTIRSTAPARDIDFLTSLIQAYLEQDINKKNYSSVRAIEYIDDQLNIIGDSLKTAEQNLQNFRRSNQVIDLSQKSGLIYEQIQELQRQKAALNIKYKYFVYLQEYFTNNQEITDIIAPSSMGVSDPLFNNLIQELIQLNNEKNNLIENNQEKSPYLRQIMVRIENLKNTITENINYMLKSAEMEMDDANQQMGELNGEVNKLPYTERLLLGYEREFNLNDEIYTFLMQRRAEAQITKSSFLPDAELVEPPSIKGNGPVAPKKRLNYVIAFLFGLIIPLTVLRMKDLLDNKIHGKEDIEKEIKLPILGQVYRNNKNIDNIIQKFPKSHIAESFRMIRNSLNYFLGKHEKNTIVITSTYAQEGKSFIAMNLAGSIALTGKSTILVACDLRKPSLGARFNIAEDKGLSSYLSNQNTLDDVIRHTEIAHLDIIVSGPVPPNPSELISSETIDILIQDLQKKYDFIIMDTPPVGIVSETYVVMNKADLNIFIIRKDVTPKSECISILKDLHNRKFKNLSIILNDITLLKKSKYGYQYYESGT